MSRPAHLAIAEALFLIREEIFPTDEMDEIDDDEEVWKCRMCGVENAEDLEYIMGKKLCADCYLQTPRFSRMMSCGIYMEENKHSYRNGYELERETIEKNAIAMSNYAPSVEIGWSQPDWDRDLTDEWVAGYQDHLRRIRIGLEMYFRKERMSDENRDILEGLHALQKTNDDLVFEMMEIIDKLKETEKMNDSDYLILCNNLKKIREQLMLLRR